MAVEIDFVITWVDGSDEEWQKEKRRYSQSDVHDDNASRYRDWEMLKYWFRSVERYAPWVRKIHLVTCGHLPKWLNTKHPKLHIVKHEDYIPKEFLPTFNSNVIEIYMNRIEGLAEHFVYFNDDMFLTKEIKPEMFFVKGLPCDMLAFQPVVANPKNPVMSHILLNDSLVLCKYFNKRECVRKRPGDYFKIGYPLMYFCYNILEMAFPLYTGFYSVHGPSPFLKESFEKVWEKEESVLTGMSGNRFRSEGDVTQYLFREWQKLEGNFKPTNILKDFRYYEIGRDGDKLFEAIRKQKSRVMCINDTWSGDDFEEVKERLHEAFQAVLPEKSAYELV